MNRQKNIFKKQISENNKYAPKSSLQFIRTKLKLIYFKRDNMKPSYKIIENMFNQQKYYLYP